MRSEDVKNVHEISYTGRVVLYPDGSRDVQCCTSAIFREPGWEPVDERPPKRDAKPREAGVKSTGDDQLRSARRARSQLRRLALSNSFQYFVTLTLDPARIDRYDGAAVVRKLNQWCDNMVRRHGLRYVLVPERHKDGAYHFHGFFAGDGLKAVDSGVKWDGRPVYNLPQWRLGYSTAQELYGDYANAVGYCCKYIGKQDGERPLGRWYYSGGALAQPEIIYADLDYNEFESAWDFEIPGARIAGRYEKQEV